jgi:hypothetical protein
MLEFMFTWAIFWYVYSQTQHLERAISWMLVTNGAFHMLNASVIFGLSRANVTQFQFSSIFKDTVPFRNGTVQRVFASMLFFHGTVRFFASMWYDSSLVFAALAGFSILSHGWMYFVEFLCDRTFFWRGFSMAVTNFTLGAMCLLGNHYY